MLINTVTALVLHCLDIKSLRGKLTSIALRSEEELRINETLLTLVQGSRHEESFQSPRYIINPI